MERPRVLIVDDDPGIREALAGAFAAGWDVAEATDGECAITVLWDGDFDAVLLDLMLPNLTGYDVLRHLSMRRPDLLARTIIVTGVGDVSLSFIDPATVFAVLHKPIDPSHVLQVAGTIGLA